MPERIPKIDSFKNPLELIKLNSLTNITSGSPEIVIGAIDGPVKLNHPDFQGSRIRTAKESQLVACKIANSLACMHGTFIAGILCAKRGGYAPAICSGCEVVLRPIFLEKDSNNNGIAPASTPEELVIAIFETIDAGTKVINLSLELSTSSLTVHPELKEAYDYACQKGVIVVVASGNKGNIGSVPLLNHPWVIPVVACNEHGELSRESNIGPSIGKRGVMAPGMNITSTSPDGQYIQMSGTSVAAPFVTGAIALLWSEFPKATATEIRQAIIGATTHHRRTITPPVFNAEAALKMLKTIDSQTNIQRRKVKMSNAKKAEELTQQTQEQIDSTKGQQTDMQTHQSSVQVESNVVPRGQEQTSSPQNAISPTGSSTANNGKNMVSRQVSAGTCCPTCGRNNLTGTETHSFIYALGTIEIPRFPNVSVEKEFAQVIKEGKTENLTDREVMYKILKENRYLALEVCWPFTIEGIETFILLPRDPLAIDQLVEAIKPMENQQLDRDVVIGVKGPIAPMEMCNGLMVPIVIFDRIYSFDIPTLIQTIPKPENIQEKVFRKASEELFNLILQMADNVGAMDEHRALNYLAVRYPAIYTKTAEMHAQDFSLSRVETKLSRLSATRKIVDVIFTYVNRKTYFTQQFFTSVDVTGKWPFLVRPLGLFLET